MSNPPLLLSWLTPYQDRAQNLTASSPPPALLVQDLAPVSFSAALPQGNQPPSSRREARSGLSLLPGFESWDGREGPGSSGSCHRPELGAPALHSQEKVSTVNCSRKHKPSSGL